MNAHAVSAELQRAMALAKAGRWPEVEEVCAALSASEPSLFPALHLRGIALLMNGKALEARSQLEAAARINPGVAGVHFNLGNALMALGRPRLAIDSYDRALSLQPALADAHFNRANAMRELGDTARAELGYLDAIRANAGLAEAHNNLGHLRLQSGRPVEAIGSFEVAVSIAPGMALAWRNLGCAALEVRDLPRALSSFNRALAIAPLEPEYLYFRGLVLQKLGHLPQALLDADRVVALRPDWAHARHVRGAVRHELRDYDGALADFAEAQRLDPGSPESRNNLGNLYFDLGRQQEALVEFEAALALRPDYPEAHCNRAMALQDLRRLDEAETALNAAISLRADYGEAFKRRAAVKLLRGQFSEGWADFERSRERGVAVGPVALASVPYWQGESLAGKAIVLSEPNGLGDAIQFFRFVPMVMAQAREVAFLGSPRLFPLLRSFRSDVRLVASADAAGDFDFQCVLWSLPYLLRIDEHNLPNAVPYLHPEPARVDRWRRWRGEDDSFAIGVAWQGNPNRKIDIGRSFPLAQLAPLARVPGVRLVSLQKHVGLEQLSSLPPDMTVELPGPDFDEGDAAFADTAAMMHALDLVVSADTAVAHLAGALGRPTWLGLRCVPEWRWMLDRSDSPWYPTVRLFRQPSHGDWATVFENMAVELCNTLG